MTDQCLHHEAVEARLATNEKDVDSLWAAMREVRDDIKHLIGKIGLIVGTITAVNSIILLVVQYVFAHAK